MATLHWQMRDALSQLRGGRLSVLTALILFANLRLRCYPSTDKLVETTGLQRAALIELKQWLESAGAYVLVPYSKRVDDELLLPRRQTVYQLTGVLKLNGRLISYLYMTPESYESVAAVVLEVSESETLAKFRKAKLSESETKVYPLGIEEFAQEGKDFKGAKNSKAGKSDKSHGEKSNSSRPQDEFFNHIARVIFQIPGKPDKASGARAGMLTAWLRTAVQPASNIEEIDRFIVWYKTKTKNKLALPRSIATFAPFFLEFRGAGGGAVVSTNGAGKSAIYHLPIPSGNMPENHTVETETEMIAVTVYPDGREVVGERLPKPQGESV